VARKKKAPEPAPLPAPKQVGHVAPVAQAGPVVTCPECRTAHVKKRCGNPNGGALGYMVCLKCTDDEGNATVFKAVAVAKVWVGNP
jgi:hypothetical protein